MQNPASDTSILEEFDGALQRVALADRTQVQHHPFACKAYRVILLAQCDQAHAGPGPRCRHLRRVRQLPAAAQESPAAQQRGDGDVEGAVGFAAQPLRLLQETESVGSTRTGPLAARGLMLLVSL